MGCCCGCVVGVEGGGVLKFHVDSNQHATLRFLKLLVDSTGNFKNLKVAC